MESLFFDLEQILKQQNIILQDLVQAADGHSQALRNNDHKQILHWVKEQESLSNHLLQLDRKREEIQQAMGDQVNIQPPVTLNKLIEYIPVTETGRSILELSEEIKKQLSELSFINQRNEVLAKRGLSFIEQVKGILQPRGGATYHSKGQVIEQDKGKSNSLLNKTI